MNNNFSRQLKEVISLSLEEALRLKSNSIGTGHLLLGMMKEGHNIFIEVLNNLKLELPELKKELEAGIETENEKFHTSAGRSGIFKFLNWSRKSLSLNKEAEKAIRESVSEAKEAKNMTVETEHLMLSILKNKEDLNINILNRFGLDYNKAVSQLRQSYSH